MEIGPPGRHVLDRGEVERHPHPAGGGDLDRADVVEALDLRAGPPGGRPEQRQGERRRSGGEYGARRDHPRLAASRNRRGLGSPRTGPGDRGRTHGRTGLTGTTTDRDEGVRSCQPSVSVLDRRAGVSVFPMQSP